MYLFVSIEDLMYYIKKNKYFTVFAVSNNTFFCIFVLFYFFMQSTGIYNCQSLYHFIYVYELWGKFLQMN